MSRWIDRIAAWLAGVACIALLVLMLLTFTDVVGRYFFSAPITFAVEITRLLMGVVITMGLAFTTLRLGHISVDLVSSAVGAMMNQVLIRASALIGAAFFALAAWQLFSKAGSFKSYGLATDVLFLPVYPVTYLMAGAVTVAMIAALIVALRGRGI